MTNVQTTNVQAILRNADSHMEKAVATVQRAFSELRGGRATPAMLDSVRVEYYGTSTPLKQLAAISAPEPRLLVVQPWDASAMGEVEKALQKANLGVTPIVDGKLVRIPLPPLTQERRAELDKLVRKLAEEGRVAVRNVRRDAKETLTKAQHDKSLSEDESFKGQEQLQQMTDKRTREIDTLLQAKETELKTL